ncbi:DUF6093 family protein [Streptomyces sp. NPDC056069]|uniref:DUF6093 family protein n=1 Tax=Streptomyces sp. NPDC056069 TaxID=3345702 RepID=UPI0035DE11CF
MTTPIPGLDRALAGIVRWIDKNLLVDTVRIVQPGTGEPVLNPATGELDYPADTVLYEGPGAIVRPAAQGDLVSVADSQLPWTGNIRSRYRLLTPLDHPGFPKDAQVTVTAVHNPANTDLLGRSWICSDVTDAATVQAVRITALDQNPGTTP